MSVATYFIRIGMAVLALSFAACGRSPKPPESQPKAVNAPPDSEFGEKPAPAAPSAGGAPTDPAGVEWLLLKMNGEDVNPSLRTTARLRLDRATSEAGGIAVCNQFKGRYELDEAGLRFGPLATTKKACPAPAMDLETKYLKALQETSRWSLEGERMVLSDAGGRPLLEFAARAGD